MSEENYAQITPDLEDRVRALERMNLKELRAVWVEEWGAPPKLRSVALLRAIIAWRLQAAAQGGIDATTRVRLRAKSIPRAPIPPRGTRLTREFRGVQYSVVIGDDVVTYGGRDYGSLSEVASEITGTHWNGPRFFGLRHEVTP